MQMQMTTARTAAPARSAHLSRSAGLALATLVLAAGLAASGATSARAATAAAAALSPGDQVLFDYAKCMRGKGVAIPDPVKGKDGKYAFPAISKSITGAAGVKAKAQSCAPKAAANGPAASNGRGGPTGFRGALGGGAQTPAQQAALKKFQNCLKQNGVTLPSRPAGAPPAASTKARATTTKPKATTKPATTTTTKTGKIVKPVIAGNGRGVGGGGVRGGGFGDAKTQAAFQKCQALLPASPGGAG